MTDASFSALHYLLVVNLYPESEELFHCVHKQPETSRPTYLIFFLINGRYANKWEHVAQLCLPSTWMTETMSKVLLGQKMLLVYIDDLKFS